MISDNMGRKKNPKPPEERLRKYPFRVDIDIWNKWESVMKTMPYRSIIGFLKDMINKGIQAKTDISFLQEKLEKLEKENRSLINQGLINQDPQPAKEDLYWEIVWYLSQQPGPWKIEELESVIPDYPKKEIEKMLVSNPNDFNYIKGKGWFITDPLEEFEELE